MTKLIVEGDVPKALMSSVHKWIKLNKKRLAVLVYGPDGKVEEMKFKIWNWVTHVLTSG